VKGGSPQSIVLNSCLKLEYLGYLGLKEYNIKNKEIAASKVLY